MLTEAEYFVGVF